MSQIIRAGHEDNDDIEQLMIIYAAKKSLLDTIPKDSLIESILENKEELSLSMIEKKAEPTQMWKKKEARGIQARIEEAKIGANRALLKLNPRMSISVDSMRFNEMSALILATARGQIKTVTALLENGAKADTAIISTGDTALTWAAKCGHADILQKLIEYKASVNHANQRGDTPLLISFSQKNSKMCETLLTFKANWRQADKSSNTVLTYVIKHGQIDILKHFVDMKADINSPDQKGLTPLLLASRYDKTDIIEFLLQDVNVPIEQADSLKQTALAWSVKSNKLPATQLLLASKANIDTENKMGQTPLILAAFTGDIKLSTLLIESKSQINHLDTDSFSTLMVAAKNGYGGLLELLIRNKALINVQTKNGASAILLAAQNDHIDCVRILVKNHAQFTEKDILGAKGKSRGFLQQAFDDQAAVERVGQLDKFGNLTVSFKIRKDDLVVGKVLGAGAYGAVHLGTYDFNQVALKKLKAELFTKDREQEFLKEASIMASIKSNYLVQLLGVCMDAPDYYMVMECVPDGSLYDLLQQPSLTLNYSQQLQIGFEIAAGLSHLHKRGILHRDLKSLNVLLWQTKYDYHAKLCDFGLVNMRSAAGGLDEKVVSNAVVGTTQWMSPEVFQGVMQSEASDIYALGLVLWELMTREVPFRKERIEIINAIQAKDLLLELKTETCQALFASKRQTSPKAETLTDDFAVLEKNEFKAKNSEQEKLLDLFKYAINQKLKARIIEIVKTNDLPMPGQAHPGLAKEIKACCQYEPNHRPSAQLITRNLFELWQAEKTKDQRELKNETSSPTQTKPKAPTPISEKLTTLDKVFHTSTIHLFAPKIKNLDQQKMPVGSLILNEGVTSIASSQVASLTTSMGLLI